MKVIAFFNLKRGTDLKQFNDWVTKEQTRIFNTNLPKMKNFRILKLLDSNNYQNLPDIVQLFDWDGTADEWRETLKKFVTPENKALLKIREEWLELCEDDSTQILYAETIE